MEIKVAKKIERYSEALKVVEILRESLPLHRVSVALRGMLERAALETVYLAKYEEHYV